MTKKNNYWEEREKKWIQDNIKSDQSLSKSLKERYEELIKTINDDINRYYMNYASRDHISMDEAIKKVAGFDVKAFEATAKKMVEDKDFSEYANERLRAYNATMRINRLEMLKAQIGQELVKVDASTEKELRAHLTQKYQDEVKRQAGILGKYRGDRIAKKVDQIINASFHGATWSQRLWVSHSELKAKLDALLTRSMIQGLNPKTLVSSLMPLISKAVNNRRYVAERLAITETARVQDQAQMDSFKDSGYEYCVWVAEPTACEQCQDIANAHDGVYPIAKVPGIPVHASCRCSKSAYVPTKEELNKWGIGEATSESADTNVYINDELKQVFGKEDSEELVRRLQQAPERMQKMWAKYQDRFAVERYEPNAGSYYSPRTQKVTVTPDAVHAANRSNYLGKYDVVYHEFGHAIDHFSVGKGNIYEKVSQLNGLGEAMNTDFVEYRDRLVPEISAKVTRDSADNLWGGFYIKGEKVTFTKKGKLSLPSARKLAEQQIGNEIRGQKNWPVYGDVSDMVEAATNGRIAPGVGHGKKYWSYTGMQSTEAFAEMTSATINNPESLTQIKRLFPNAYKKYLSIVDDIIKTE